MYTHEAYQVQSAELHLHELVTDDGLGFIWGQLEVQAPDPVGDLLVLLDNVQLARLAQLLAGVATTLRHRIIVEDAVAAEARRARHLERSGAYFSVNGVSVETQQRNDEGWQVLRFHCEKHRPAGAPRPGRRRVPRGSETVTLVCYLSPRAQGQIAGALQHLQQAAGGRTQTRTALPRRIAVRFASEDERPLFAAPRTLSQPALALLRAAAAWTWRAESIRRLAQEDPEHLGLASANEGEEISALWHALVQRSSLQRSLSRSAMRELLVSGHVRRQGPLFILGPQARALAQLSVTDRDEWEIASDLDAHDALFRALVRDQQIAA